jgi:hypothetical protein
MISRVRTPVLYLQPTKYTPDATFYSAYPPQGNATPEAMLYAHANRLFWRSYLLGQLRRVWCWICRRPSRLQSLESQRARLTNACFTGSQEVPLSAIRGSESRAGDYDTVFHPLQPTLRPRWVQVAAAYLQGRGLPPVELIRVGKAYFVRDGHHRVSAARACQHISISASVTNWQVKEQPRRCAAEGAPGINARAARGAG